jgi:CheY-like chemotaxis protein/HAMP domain-containing protein/putative methionine-R-sulfoxide reductase with GAF domain
MILRNLNIAFRLSLGFGLLLVMTAYLFALSVRDMNRLEEKIVDMYNHPLKVSNAVRDVNAGIISIHRFMKDVVLAENEQELIQLKVRIDNIEQEIYGYFDIIFSQYLGKREDVELSYTTFRDWKYIRDEVILLVEHGKYKEAAAITKGKGFDHITSLDNQVKTLREFASNKADEFYIASVNDKKVSFRKLSTITLVMLILSGIVALLVTRSISVPINRINNSIRRIAEGDLSSEVKISSKDEVGQLAVSFNLMRQNLLHKAEVADFIALGEYTECVQAAGNNDSLAASMNQIVETFNILVNQTKQIALGNYNIDVNLRSKNDQLGLALREMINRFQEVVEQTKRISSGDYTGKIEVNNVNDELAIAINKMTEDLQIMTYRNKRTTTIKAALAELSKLIQGDLSIEDIANKSVSFIANFTNAAIGALYAKISEERVLRLAGSYAFTFRKGLSNEYKIGEGIVGQAAYEKKTISLTEVPEDYIQIQSAISQGTPKNLIVTPLMHEGELIGVLELGSTSQFSDDALEFLRESLQIVSIALLSSQNRLKMNRLLRRTQQQTDELQQQQEELTQKNEELEQQTKALRKSEESLQSQQEELRVTNEELEERTKDLQLQKEQINKAMQDVEKANKQIQLKADEVEEASKYKSEFLANMSHELRTPLNSLLIISQSLSENKLKNLNGDQLESLRIIYDSGKYLLNLINEILDLSKIEAGKMHLDIDTIDINKLLLEMQNAFREDCAKKGIEYKTSKIGEVQNTFTSDKVRVGQILRNLLSNAIKFTEKGFVELTAREASAEELKNLKNFHANAAIVFSISDTGIGIPQGKLNTIFGAFQQVDGSISRKYGGTGLGLSITSQLLSILQGDIRVKSEPGKGSEFTVFLPLVIEEKEGEQNDSGNLNVAKQESNKSIPTERSEIISFSELEHIPDDRENTKKDEDYILIVEDDQRFAQVLYDQCKEKDFKCLVAPSGEEALELVKKYKVCAIILDLGLPGISGVEVLEKLKNEHNSRHIPVHIISGYEDEVDILNKGALGFLKKPVDKDELNNLLSDIGHFITKEVKNLLIIEDNEVLREKIIDLLKGQDIKIEVASSGAEALSKLKKNSFDCLILDLGLPDYSGFELLTKAEQEKIEIPPIIVYTGKELSVEENEQLQRHANSIIIKGVKSEERLIDETALFLHRVIEDLPLDQKKLLNKLYNKEEMFRGKKVLIADDDIRNIFALTKLFEENNIEVLRAENGQKALEILEENKGNIDLVLMDIMMPVMDGYEAIVQIRKNPGYSKIPVIAVTAKAMKSDRDKCIEVGANDYISKPVDIEQLFTLMRVWLYQ